MPRRSQPPQYRKHSSGQARVVIDGQVYYLGVYGTPESHAEYERLIGEWRRTQTAPEARSLRGPTVGDAVLAFLRHAREKYGAGKNSEVGRFEDALRVVSGLFVDLPTRSFGTLELLEVQKQMAARWGRRVVNRHLVRVRTFWRWAELQKLAPPGSWQALRAVRGIDGPIEDVPPVPEDDLAKTLAACNPTIGAIARTQLLTGSRPSEVLGLRPSDFLRKPRVEISRGVWLETEGIWVVLLTAHKTAWRGHRRLLLFGPQSQAVLTPFLDRPADRPLFCPEETYRRWFASRGRRVNLDHSRRPRQQYDRDSYRRAIYHACDRAGVPHWSPHQLRHNAASRLAAEFGPEVARIVLGHRDLGITRKYVEDDLRKAVDAMKKAG